MKLKHWLRLSAFTLVTVFALSGLTNFLCVPEVLSSVVMYGFYKEPKNSIDVALIGPSNIQTSFYSPLAYEQQGFTSYSMSVSSMRGLYYISAFEEMRTRQTPQVYVVDMWGFIYEPQFDPGLFRCWSDVIPSSPNRTKTIEMIVPREDQDDYLWRYRKYHSNWTELAKCARSWNYKSQIDTQGYSIVKNFTTKTSIEKLENLNSNGVDVTTEGFAALRELVAYLKENNIRNVLFIRSLDGKPYGDTPVWDEAVAYLQSEGFDYLDIAAAADEMGIDRNRDFYNKGHVNIFGAEKVTSFLARYLADHYQINTAHTDQVREEWEHCASYNDYVLEKCKERTDKQEGRGLYEGDFFR